MKNKEKDAFFNKLHADLADQLGISPHTVEIVRKHLIGDKQTVEQTAESIRNTLRFHKSKPTIPEKKVQHLKDALIFIIRRESDVSRLLIPTKYDK